MGFVGKGVIVEWQDMTVIHPGTKYNQPLTMAQETKLPIIADDIHVLRRGGYPGRIGVGTVPSGHRSSSPRTM